VGRYPKSQGQPQGRVRTLAGGGAKGYVNGNRTVARFNEPTGIAVDAARNVYVPGLGTWAWNLGLGLGLLFDSARAT
jgi:hypothetical protein